MLRRRWREACGAPRLAQHHVAARREFEKIEHHDAAEGGGRGESRQRLDDFQRQHVGGDADPKHDVTSASTVIALSLILESLEGKLVTGIAGAGDRSHLVTEITGRFKRMDRGTKDSLRSGYDARAPAQASGEAGTVELIHERRLPRIETRDHK